MHSESFHVTWNDRSGDHPSLSILCPLQYNELSIDYPNCREHTHIMSAPSGSGSGPSAPPRYIPRPPRVVPPPRLSVADYFQRGAAWFCVGLTVRPTAPPRCLGAYEDVLGVCRYIDGSWIIRKSREAENGEYEIREHRFPQQADEFSRHCEKCKRSVCRVSCN